MIILLGTSSLDQPELVTVECDHTSECVSSDSKMTSASGITRMDDTRLSGCQ